MKPFSFVLFCLLIASSVFGEVTLSTIIGDHMVIQRDEVFTIQGSSTIEKTIRIHFNGKTRNAICSNNKWSVSFSAMKAGGPYSIVILGENTIKIEDIYFGDVYLCSGQSNMQWPFNSINNAEKEALDTDYPLIRIYTVERGLMTTKKDVLGTGEWSVSNSETTSKFSAIGFLFARELYKKHQIPIGLIDNAWGGSEIDPYMDEICFHDKEEYLQSISKFKASDMTMEKSKLIIKNWIDGFDNADLGRKEQWERVEYSKNNWTDVDLPGQWETNIWVDYDGVGWYSKSFNLQKKPSRNVILNLGQIDDSDHTYINGNLVGSMINSYNLTRNYTVDPNFFNVGKNEIVIRVTDYHGGGGISAIKDDFNIDLGDNKINLSGNWKAKRGMDNYPRPENTLNQNDFPTSKYNSMVHPLIDQKLSGVLWYQGESDWNNRKDYEWLMTRLITDYRAKWNQPYLPFMYVQLANWTAELDTPSPSNWGEVRNAQDMSLNLSHTAMITAIDVGEAEDIHPRDKQTLARRFAKAAAVLVYGEKEAYQSPRFRKARIVNDGYEITFDHIGNGLSLKSGSTELKGFSILVDGKIEIIDANIIENNRIHISMPDPKPTLIRFLWADNPGEVTLYNSDDLPALPFQTFVERKK